MSKYAKALPNIASVIQISYDDVQPWVINVHYAHRIPNIQYAFGILIDNLIKGICTFGIPASPFLCKGICGEQYSDKVIELNRLVVDADAPKNTASFLISHSINLLPSPKIIVSYADTEMGHIGYVYQATNFLYTGCTKGRTDMFAGNGKHSRHNLGNSTMRQYRSPKHRYVFFHKCPKYIKNSLRYAILPYPKGETQCYITSSLDKQQYMW